MMSGKDCAEEVPPERWDAEFPPLGAYSGGAPHPAEEVLAKMRFGAFVSGVDRFDATYFGVAPEAARNWYARMNPPKPSLTPPKPS
eukprot:1182481-Prorocentrum_minimum.AAC.1